MSITKRLIASLVIVSVFSSATGVVHAQAALAAADSVVVQEPAPTGAAAGDTMAAGLIDGEMLAEGHRTGGNFGTGLGVGVLTGLVGTGIGYFVIGPEDLSPEALQRSAGRSDDYQLGLRTGWERKTQSKKRKAFLAGGLLGTAAFVAVFVAASGGEQ